MSERNSENTTDRDNPELVARVVNELRDSEFDVPSDALARLAQARRAAVAAADSAPVLWPRYVGAGAGAFASIALVVALLLQPGLEPLPPLDDPELVVAQDVELMEELEFAAWILAMEDADDAPNSG